MKYKDQGEGIFKNKIKNEIQSTIPIEGIVPEEFTTKDSQKTLLDSTGSSFVGKPVSTDLSNEDNAEAEVIVLKDKVSPSEFAKTLKNKNVKGNIDYIQPDFQMELNSVGDTTTVSDGITNSTSVTGTASKETLLDETNTNRTLVAIMDTGMDITHPDLKDYIYVNQNEIPNNSIDDDGNGYVDDINGWNFPDNSGAVYDASLGLDQAHATHIAGIAAGLSNADGNLTSNDDIQILPLKVFSDGTAYTSDIIAAIEYADKMGAKIVNCSFGSTSNNPALKEAMENSDMLFVCSAGNARTDLAVTPIFPACFGLDNIISVTSVNTDGGLSYFSNYNSNLVDVAALGRDINSTLPDGKYGLQTGTSMSTALVSGVAAKTLNMDATLNTIELKDRLLSTSVKLSNLQDTVSDGRAIRASNAIGNIVQTNISQNTPVDDFEVMGYNPTQSELYQLYSAGIVMKIAAGEQTILVLKDDGTVWAWGENSSGQCGNGSPMPSICLAQVVGLTNAKGLSTDGYHSLAVKTDGTVWAWGQNGNGQLGDGTTTNRSIPVQVNGLTGVASVFAGYGFSFAIKSDGTVWAWGNNANGQLGDGTTVSKSTPVQISSLTSAVNISGGGKHGLAIKSNGTVWAWGNNGYGQLGDGTTVAKTTPIQISSLTGALNVSAGYSHSLAVKADGTVWAFGWNAQGQLGDGTTTSRTAPVQVSGVTGASNIAAGYNHSMVLKSDQTVWDWGRNNVGQLGDGTTIDRTKAVRASSLTNAKSIYAGTGCSFALKLGGIVWAWGDNERGQLADGKPIVRSVPVQITSLTSIVGITAGKQYSHVIKSGGTVWGCGDNASGLLGDGTVIDKSAPVQLSGLTGISNISSFYHSLAVKSDGTVAAWGWNMNGELGDGTIVDKTSPVTVSSLTGVSSVSTGDSHSLALKTAGTVWAWGYNSSGQLGNGTTTSQTTPVQVSSLTGVTSIAAGQYHSVALKSGTVWTWGKNTYGQIGDGTTTKKTTAVQVGGLTGVVSIGAGLSHTLAVKSDGTVWAWGRNNYGQLGDGTTTDKTTPVQVSGLTGVVRVAAGDSFCLAVKSDGTVWAWGRNNYGQLGDGTVTDRSTPVRVSGLTGVTIVEGGEDHSLAIKSDGTIWGWGSDYGGQLGQGRVLISSVPYQSQAYVGVLNFQASSYAADIPTSGPSIVTVSANGMDNYGNPIPAASISYRLTTSYAGVTINSTTGVVTISPSAQAGTVQVTAAYQNLTCNTTISLVVPIIVFANDTYEVPLRVSNITNFSGKTLTLTYDTSVLELVDLCTFSKAKETTAGAISGTGITISSVSPGTVVLVINKTVPSGQKWSGVIDSLRFRVKTTGKPNVNFTCN